MFQYPNGNIGPRLGCEYRGKLYFESLDQVYNMIDRQRGYDDDDDDDD